MDQKDNGIIGCLAQLENGPFELRLHMGPMCGTWGALFGSYLVQPIHQPANIIVQIIVLVFFVPVQLFFKS